MKYWSESTRDQFANLTRSKRNKLQLLFKLLKQTLGRNSKRVSRFPMWKECDYFKQKLKRKVKLTSIFEVWILCFNKKRKDLLWNLFCCFCIIVTQYNVIRTMICSSCSNFFYLFFNFLLRSLQYANMRRKKHILFKTLF